MTVRRSGLRLVALGASAPGLIALLMPGTAALPWLLAPLHGRCIAVMQLVLLLPLWRAWRSGDPALERAPLRALTASSAGSAFGLLAIAAVQRELPPITLAWLLVFALLGGGAEWLTRAAHELQAPAERPDRAWFVIAGLAGGLSLALLVAPAAMATLWPWRMGPTLAAAYIGPFAALGALAFQLARERRAYVRRVLLLALLTLPLAVLGVSAWHLSAFNKPSAVLWFATFAALAALATWRLATLPDRYHPRSRSGRSRPSPFDSRRRNRSA